jgi:hypothetical protein
LNKETNKGRSESNKVVTSDARRLLAEYYKMADDMLANSAPTCTDFSPRMAAFGVICMIALIGTFFL